jgi:endonuclease YncB( thermonuclease family)
MNLRTSVATSLLLALLASLPTWAADLTGKIVRVIDGDTVVVLAAQKTHHKVRLAGIDVAVAGAFEP